ncbi:MAG: amidohydrolase, partial [Saprospiraceae bacterium]|nr:amidohydrolase [Saprospiraceae bacterium]
MKKLIIPFFILLGIQFCISQAPVPEAPLVEEGEGPFNQLIIRGCIMINGAGAPPQGPVDIIVENNKIVKIQTVGYPGVPIDSSKRPKLKPGGHEIEAEGHYVLPGLVDMHGHIGGRWQGAGAEYVFKLWMAHGITTIRDPSCGNGLEWVLKHKKLSEQNKITAPRIQAYTAFGMGEMDGINTPEQAKQWVRNNATRGADGIKFFGLEPKIFEAALAENKRLG